MVLLRSGPRQGGVAKLTSDPRGTELNAGWKPRGDLAYSHVSADALPNTPTPRGACLCRVTPGSGAYRMGEGRPRRGVPQRTRWDLTSLVPPRSISSTTAARSGSRWSVVIAATRPVGG